jgi:large subunit ribosomal protein L18
MRSPIDKPALRRRVRYRIRREISGTAGRPRLAVFRSNRHIYVQVVDDEGGKTVASASTMDKEIRSKVAEKGATIEAATEVGTLVGERLKKAGVETVVFDRGGYQYHGRVRALAEATRSAGIKF